MLDATPLQPDELIARSVLMMKDALALLTDDCPAYCDEQLPAACKRPWGGAQMYWVCDHVPTSPTRPYPFGLRILREDGRSLLRTPSLPHEPQSRQDERKQRQEATAVRAQPHKATDRLVLGSLTGPSTSDDEGWALPSRIISSIRSVARYQTSHWRGFSLAPETPPCFTT
jgi:hypothetical protein